MNTDPAVRLTLPRLVSAEWLKLRTLRSFWACAVTAVVLAVGGAVLQALSWTDPLFNEDTSAREAVTDVLATSAGVLQIVIVVLAVLALSSEYTGGAIRVTFVAVPRRLTLMAAKALVVTVVATLLASISLTMGYAAALPLLLRGSVGVMPYGTVLGLLGVEIGYCVLVALFAFAVTLMVRNAAAGVTLTPGVVLPGRVVLFMIDAMAGFVMIRRDA